jgi:hypothetical protein
MKQLLAALALAAVVAFSAQSASAISVQLDVPVAADLTLKQAGSTPTNVGPDVSGAIVGINFGLIGLQYENYTDSKSNLGGSGGGTLNFEVNMVDLAINLPIPYVNLAIGGGVGTGKFGGAAISGVTASTANLTQYFVQAGIPVGKMFDVHVSYRVFSGTSDFEFLPGVKTTETIDGSTTTVGVRFGF